MKYSFNIEGTFSGLTNEGDQAGTESTSDHLPGEMHNLMQQLVTSPEKYNIPDIKSQPDEGQYNLQIEDGGKKYDFKFSDFNMPEEVQPLITYLRKQVYDNMK